MSASQPPKSGESPALPPGLTFKLVHVGVAVPAGDPAAAALHALFGYRVLSGPFDDPIQRVTLNFLALPGEENQPQVELIAPLTDDSPIRSMLKKNSGGAYHLCFETNDLEAALAHTQEQGCRLIAPPAPAVAFGGRRIAWIYAPTNQLFELVESTLQPAP